MHDFSIIFGEMSAWWGESMLRASVEGGIVIALVWGLCRAWPQMSPSGRSWLWRAAFCKLLLALLWRGSVGVPLLPAPSASEGAAHSSFSSRSAQLEPSRAVIPAPMTNSEAGPEAAREIESVPSLETDSKVWDVAKKGETVAPQNDPALATPAVEEKPLTGGTLTVAAFAFWLLGVGFLALRSVAAWRWTRRLRESGELVDDVRLFRLLDDLRARFGLARAPEMLRCTRMEALALTGVLRPAILLPPGFALAAPEQEADLALMLAHELAHHKRRDLAWNWLLWAGQTLFWFHPLVWLGAREWRLAQEVACDALAVRATRAPLDQYSAMLMKSALTPRGERAESLFSVGVSARYATLHRRLGAMKYFTLKAENKRALALCGLLAGLVLVPWRLTARPASAQATPQNLPAPPDSAAPVPPARRAPDGRAQVSGTVLDAAGRPIRGATVVIPADLTNDRLLTARTDAAGRFSFRVAALTDAKFECWAKIYATGWALQGTRLEEGRSATIRLQRGTTIRGIVRDSQGRPVARVAVALDSVAIDSRPPVSPRLSKWLWVPDPLKPALTTRTDARGHYELRGIPAHFDAARLEIHDSRFIHRRFEVRLRPARAAVAPVQTLRGASHIVGRVVNAQGVGLRGIKVYASGNGSTMGEIAWSDAISRRDGSYRISSLPPGTFQLMARDLNDKVVMRPVRGIKTRLAGVTRAPDLQMRPGGVVEGTVVDADSGKPLAGALVSGGGTGSFSSSFSTRQGRYRVRIPAGKGQVYISALPRGYLPPALGSSSRAFPVQVGEGEAEKLTLRLKKGVTLRGTALDSQGRAPKEALLVATKIVPRWMSSRWEDENFARPDSNGQWSIEGLSAGRYRLGVRGDWEIAGAPREVEVPSPDAVRLELRAAPLPTLAGRVVTPEGRPISGASIGLNINFPIPSGSLMGSKEKMTSDAQGRFARPRLRPDSELFLKPSKTGYRFVSGGRITRVKTARGTQFRVSDIVMARANLEEILRAGATVAGRVVYSGGQPARVRVWLSASGDYEDSLRRTLDWRGQNNARLLPRLTVAVPTRADGRFEIAKLPALSYSMSILDLPAGWFWSGDWRWKRLAVPSDRRKTLRLPDMVLQRGAVVQIRAIDRDTGETLRGEIPLRYSSTSQFGKVEGPTYAPPSGIGQKTVPPGIFSLGIWRNPDGRIVHDSAHMTTPTNRFIRYYEITSPTLEVSVDGGPRQRVRDGRVTFPVAAGKSYQVTYFLHRLRPEDSQAR